MGGRTNDCLLIIDVHNDFCPGGAPEVPNSDEVTPITNDLRAHYADCILTQTRHDIGSFVVCCKSGVGCLSR
mgnify:CR=1 FL=1